MGEKRGDYKETIKRASNEIKFLLEEIKILIPYGDTYFLYNMNTGAFRSEYDTNWFNINGAEFFQSFVIDIVYRERCAFYNFVKTANLGMIYTEDGNIGVLFIERISEFLSSNLKNNIEKKNNLIRDIGNIIIEFSRINMVDNLSNELLDAIINYDDTTAIMIRLRL